MSATEPETVFPIPSRFDIAAVAHLTEKHCSKELEALKQCENMGDDLKDACRKDSAINVDRCIAQQVAYSQMNCPVSFNALVQCLESSNNDMNACEHYLNEFNACINNIHAL